MSLATIVWTISFKLPGQTAQAEIKKYTEDAANKVAGELEMLGAVVVVTEDAEETPVNDHDGEDDLTAGKNKLNWN